jgi:hypothetical protein
MTLSVGQIVLTKSGMGLVLLTVFGGAKFAAALFTGTAPPRKRLGALIVGASVMVLGLVMFTVNPVLSESRAGYLLTGAVRDPVELALDDASLRTRLFNPVVGLYGGLVVTRGLGFRLSAGAGEPAPVWLAALTGSRFWGDKNLGGVTEPVYELGVIGLLVPTAIVWILTWSIKRSGKHRAAVLVSAATLLVMVLFSESLASPYVGYLLGIHLSYAYPRVVPSQPLLHS